MQAVGFSDICGKFFLKTLLDNFFLCGSKQSISWKI